MIFVLVALALVLSITEISFERIRVFRRKIVRKFKNEKNYKEISLLYGNKAAGTEQEKYIAKKIRNILLVLIAGTLLAALCTVNERLNPNIYDGYTIGRPDYGKGYEEINIYASGGPVDKEKIRIKVSDRLYKDEQIKEMAEEVRERIYRDMLLSNSSVDHINENMNLMNSIDGYPFSIIWKSEKPIIISKTGELNKKKIKERLSEAEEESIILNLYAILKYEDYYEEIEIPICVEMPIESEESRFLEKIQNSISVNDKGSRDGEKLVLPQIVDGEVITYEEETSVTAIMILMLSIIAAIGLYIGQDNDLSKRTAERNEQMEDDYPGIVNRYALYYCAGMHPKTIWKEMCRDYRLKLSKGMDRRYAYEAMLKSEAMMNDGIGDMDSLNEFALECRMKSYRKFVNLIEQVLIKGKDEMGKELKAEAEDAVNERLIRAKIKGEQAGTKLLLPMFMMLSVVLIIVIVPAFINFKM